MTTLFFNRMRNNFNQSKIANKSENHNLRLDPENKNYIQSKTKNNIYLIEDGSDFKQVKTNEKNLQQVKRYIDYLKEKEKKDYQENNFTDFDVLSNEKKKQLTRERTLLKSKLKKWIDNEKTQEEEKEIFQKVLKDIEEEKEFNKKNIDDFLNIKNKILKRNDKKKVLEKVTDFDVLIGSKNRNFQLKIQSSEVIFKIPDHNKINVKSKHWKEIIQDYIKDNYPDNRLLYAAIHLDENEKNSHAHVSISGYNSKTKDYDMPDQEMKILNLHMSGEYPFKDKKWRELTEEQRQKHGEIYQDYIFNFMNEKLKEYGYSVKFEKKTKEQIEEDNYSFTKTKRSADREYNLQNKMNEENKKQEQKLKELKQDRNKEQRRLNIIKNQNRQIEEQQNELKEEIENDKNLLHILKENIQKIIKIPAIINKSFQNLVDIYRHEESDFKVFQELEQLDNELNKNLEDLNLNNKDIKKITDKSILDTVDSIKNTHSGTQAEKQAIDTLNTEISNKTRKKPTR